MTPNEQRETKENCDDDQITELKQQEDIIKTSKSGGFMKGIFRRKKSKKNAVTKKYGKWKTVCQGWNAVQREMQQNQKQPLILSNNGFTCNNLPPSKSKKSITINSKYFENKINYNGHNKTIDVDSDEDVEDKKTQKEDKPPANFKYVDWNFFKGRIHKSYQNEWCYGDETGEEWKKGEQYAPGDLVWHYGITEQEYKQIENEINQLDNNDENAAKIRLKQLTEQLMENTTWSVCMKEHIANAENRPHRLDTFEDLIKYDLIPSMKDTLSGYFEKVLNEQTNVTDILCDMIIGYCYKTTKLWWNGCKGLIGLEFDLSGWSFWGSSEKGCGNLVYGLDTDYCKVCRLFADIPTKILLPHELKDGMYCLSRDEGAIIKLFNVHDVYYQCPWGNKESELYTAWSAESIFGGEIIDYRDTRNNLPDVIDVEAAPQLYAKIKQLEAQTEDKMAGKVIGCKKEMIKEHKDELIELKEDQDENKDEMKFKETFIDFHVGDSEKKHVVSNLMKRNFHKDMHSLIDDCVNNPDIYNTHIWGLYDKNDNDDYNELLCGLIWRDIQATEMRMFEVLFLSTSEHVRHNKYGSEMYKHIERYALQNCIQILSVAAVPMHGIKFWENNGFEQYVAPNQTKKDDKKDRKFRIGSFLLENMLKFIDTPLYAKLVW